MRLHSLFLIAALGITTAVAEDTAKAQTAATAPISVTDPQEFASMATASNMFEIESSRLALEKAASPDAKAFAQHMIDDHTKAGEEMKAAAENQGGINLPSSVNDKHKQMLDQLNAATGADFETQYLSMQVSAHKEAVALFDAFSTNGSEGPLKDFARKTLPTLQQHLEMVSTIPSGGAQAANSAAMTTPAAATVQPDSSILAAGYVPTDTDNLSTEIVGQQVYSSAAGDAEHIGDVNNLVIAENGQVAAVVIGVGGFLGLGEKSVAVNYSELKWVTADDKTERFILATTKEALEAAPNFQSSDQPAAPSAATPAAGASTGTPAAATPSTN